MTKTRKRILVSLLCVVLTFGAAFLGLQKCYVVPIIMYHRVSDETSMRADTVSKKYFEFQLEYLKDHQYQVLTMDELVEGIKNNRRFPRRSVVLTFDDGTADNYTTAFPVIKQYGYPAIIFISPALIGQAGYLTWEQVKAMRVEGIDLGTHGMTHVYLPDSPAHVQLFEIENSKKFLEQELGHLVKYMAYPIGGFNDDIIQMVRQAGYQAALTTNRGQHRLNKDPFQLNRIRFSDKDNSPIILWAKLSGYYNLFREAKSPY